MWGETKINKGERDGDSRLILRVGLRRGDCVEMMSRLRSDNESVSKGLWNRCEDFCDVHLLIKVIAIVDNDSLTLVAVIDSIIFPSMHIEFPD